MKILKISLFILIATALFTSCQKEYSLEGNNLKVPDGSWEFKDSLKQFIGNIDTAFIDSSGSTKTLTLSGTSITGGENFSLRLFTTGNFNVGSYRASLAESEFNYFTITKTIYQANQLVGEFIVNITSLANNMITGTFSGSAQDSAGNIKQITIGKFSSSINLNAANGTATGTLGSLTGNCVPIFVAGTFTQGLPITATDTVKVQVNVATAGTYTISTNSVNGVVFSSSGTFTTTGLQDVFLIGTGTPVNSGTQNYTVTFGSSNCNFSITFAPGNPSTEDYFPLTLNSNWAYDISDGVNTDSVLFQVINYTPTFAGVTYSTITTDFIPPAGSPDSNYFRKPGGDYYQYGDISSAFNFDNPVYGEGIFLKDNVIVGTTWQSPNFSGTISSVAVTGYTISTLLAKAVPVTIGTQSFSDVIKVKADFYFTAAPGIPVATRQAWYARGVGLIHQDDGGTSTLDIRRYQVF